MYYIESLTMTHARTVSLVDTSGVRIYAQRRQLSFFVTGMANP
jgi:hypothetical protein